MKNTKQFVAYFRVSTKRQGASGLGLEAQKKSVADYVANNGQVVAEFVEIETGKRADRPQLNLAIELCKKHGYTLCVAKLDRLARNLFFVASLANSKVDFVAVDNFSATPFVIHVLSAVAEQEAVAISARTKAALQAYKARGGTLGNPRIAEARVKANETRTRLATKRNSRFVNIINEIKSKTGLTKLAELAEAMNLRGLRTARNKTFTASHIFNILQTA